MARRNPHNALQAPSPTELEGETALKVAENEVAVGDKDHDGEMNAFEFEKRLTESKPFRQAVFKAFDQDGDGKMDAEPWEALEKTPAQSEEA